MEKLADNLQHLNEEDLLLVVQMIHDNKSSETWTKNDVERKSHRPPQVWLLTWIAEGEFQVDLYTLPDSLIHKLWDFTNEKIAR